jgi:hypothetical protein
MCLVSASIVALSATWVRRPLARIAGRQLAAGEPDPASLYVPRLPLRGAARDPAPVPLLTVPCTPSLQFASPAHVPRSQPPCTPLMPLGSVDHFAWAQGDGCAAAGVQDPDSLSIHASRFASHAPLCLVLSLPTLPCCHSVASTTSRGRRATAAQLPANQTPTRYRFPLVASPARSCACAAE